MRGVRAVVWACSMIRAIFRDQVRSMASNRVKIKEPAKALHEYNIVVANIVEENTFLVYTLHMDITHAKPSIISGCSPCWFNNQDFVKIWNIHRHLKTPD